MYDKDKLKEELTIEEIETLLIELGAQHIESHLDKGHIITNTICHNISDGKMKLYYYLEKKVFHCYTGCAKSFDIYELVILNHALRGIEIKLNEAIKWVLRKLGKETTASKPIGFGAMPMEVQRRKELDWLESLKTKKPVVVEMKEYSDYTLELFSKEPHPLFLADNISEDAMRKFEIMYYEKTNRIIIPHRSHDTGKIIGIKSRSLDFEDIDKGFKYIPLKIQDVLYSYPTYQNLYGLYQNKDFIKKIKKVIIFESEKSVLQFETYFPERNFSVALCGSNINKQQVDMIIKLNVEEVIIALDKEFVEQNSEQAHLYREKIERICKMFSCYTKVSMIWDSGKLLGLKESPSDRGKDTLVELFKKRRIIKT